MGVTESHLLALLGETLAGDDAEWMPGKSRTRLAPGLDNGFLMDDRSGLAGLPALADDRRLPGPRAAGRSPAQEDRRGGNRPLPGTSDVVDAAASTILAGVGGGGGVTSARAQQKGAVPFASPSPRPGVGEGRGDGEAKGTHARLMGVYTKPVPD